MEKIDDKSEREEAFHQLFAYLIPLITYYNSNWKNEIIYAVDFKKFKDTDQISLRHLLFDLVNDDPIFFYSENNIIEYIKEITKTCETNNDLFKIIRKRFKEAAEHTMNNNGIAEYLAYYVYSGKEIDGLEKLIDIKKKLYKYERKEEKNVFDVLANCLKKVMIKEINAMIRYLQIKINIKNLYIIDGNDKYKYVLGNPIIWDLKRSIKRPKFPSWESFR